MIRYALTCEQGHQFDSWFQSAEGFDTLRRAGHLACAVCGSSDVSKSVMAPGLSTKGALTVPSSKAEEAVGAFRKSIEANSEDVGTNFATEARAMHEGDAPERAIYGEAKLEDAKSLVEDGIPVVPLPFLPKRKTN